MTHLVLNDFDFALLESLSLSPGQKLGSIGKSVSYRIPLVLSRAPSTHYQQGLRRTHVIACHMAPI